MKTFTKLISVFLFTHLIIIGSVYSQTSKTVVVADMGGDYTSIVQAANEGSVDMASGDTLYITIPEGTKVEPSGNHFINWGKLLHVVISGAGADKTIITRTDEAFTAPTGEPPTAVGNPLTAPPPTEAPGLGGRLFAMAANADMVGSTLTVKNLSFKYMGNTTGQATGSVINFQGPLVINVKFENIIFDQCVGRALVNHNNYTIDLAFENVLFINCVSSRRTDNTEGHQGLVQRAFGGKTTFRNVTFMSNKVNTTDVHTGNTGGLIRMVGDRAPIYLTLENVVAINNRYTQTSSSNVKHTMMTFQGGVANDPKSISVSLKNVVAIDNAREDNANDVDILLIGADSVLISEESSGNYINKALRLVGTDYSEPTITGTNISIDNSYQSLNFTMQGPLPQLTPDEFGVGKVSYQVTGVKQNQLHALKVYSFNSMVKVSGLNPGDKLYVYTITGSLYSGKTATDSEISFEMPKGLYIIKSGNRTGKVIVY
jgi:hypothetical protein